jgi:hypothetical protein
MDPETGVVVDDEDALSHLHLILAVRTVRDRTAGRTPAGRDPNPETRASLILALSFTRNPWPMLFRKHIEEIDMTAAEVRSHLLRLQGERALAVDTGVAEADLYLADIDEELEVCRELYTWSAVTEIATLRAEMFGPEIG